MSSGGKRANRSAFVCLDIRLPVTRRDLHGFNPRKRFPLKGFGRGNLLADPTYELLRLITPVITLCRKARAFYTGSQLFSDLGDLFAELAQDKTCLYESN